MAISKEEQLLQLFNKLPESDKNSTLDFMEYLANRKQSKELERFYSTLPEIDESLSKNEEEQMRDPEFISWEDACNELGWDDADQTK